MNCTTFIDSCQAHLSVQYTSSIELIRQKLHWCCDWQGATRANRPLVCFIGLSFVDLMPRMIQLNLTDASRVDVEFILSQAVNSMHIKCE